MSVEDEFAAKLLKAIDKGLQPIGESAKRSLYLYARRTHKLSRYQIPQMPSEFSEVIQEVYGRLARRIERSIIENIARDFALNSTPSSLKDAVDMASRQPPA